MNIIEKRAECCEKYLRLFGEYKRIENLLRYDDSEALFFEKNMLEWELEKLWD